MAGLDTRYIPLVYMQGYNVNKDDGAPLAAGQIYFYQDAARTILKPVFKITGNPPDYSYVELPNPLTLSSIGTFMDDDGNDINPYFFPYDENGNVQLYYAAVFTYGDDPLIGVPQWTRQGIPNIGLPSSSATGGSFNKNFVPNGQFLLHFDLPNNGLIASGVGATTIAHGNHDFGQPPGSTSTNYVTFEKFGSYVTNPSTSPRYACRIKCTAASISDTYKHYVCRFNDANKFSSDTQVYTFYFTAKSNNGTHTVVDLNIVKFYGTGGQGYESRTVQSGINIDTSYQTYAIPFVFLSNDSKVFGPTDDDYVDIRIAFPATYAFDISLTDIAIFPGSIQDSSFPVTTNSEFIYQSIFNKVPDPKGYDLGLPLVLTQNGVDFDSKDIGKIVDHVRTNAISNYLPLDGTQYDADAYSSLGIPYRRLQRVLYASGLGIPMEFVSIYPLSNGNATFVSNQPGITQIIQDGTSATGFTFSDITLGGSSYGFTVFNNGVDIICQSDVSGINGNTVSTGTSGFNVEITLPGDVGLYQKVSIGITDITGLEGAYFQIASITNQYYVWFTVNGVGSDPALVGTGIRVDLLSSHTLNDVIMIVTEALNGRYLANILSLPGSSIIPGSWFKFYNQIGMQYIAYFTIDGIGSPPGIVAEKTFVIECLSTDTSEEVIQKISDIINVSYFSVPDYRGFFRRTWLRDGHPTSDPDANSRVGYYSSAGNNIGSIQYTQNLAHTHVDQFGNVNNEVRHDDNLTALIPGGNTPSLSSGGNQSNPLNVYVNTFIIY